MFTLKPVSKLFMFAFFICLAVGQLQAQSFEQPSEGKSLVYFVRSSGTGALVNFKYFDGETFLGKNNGVHYFKYECEPGEHLFWIASENRDFLKADLKPNATYVFEARPTMGAFKAAARLYPVAPNNEKMLKRINKLMSKRAPTQLKGLDDDMAFFIKSGMERYEKIKDDVKVLDNSWTFN